MTAVFARAAAAAGGALGMAARGTAIARHLRQVDPRRLRQFVARVMLAAQCLRDVARRRYPHVPWKTVAALGTALAYFVAPIDAVPDVIPLSGFLDDAALLAVVFGAAESDLRRYCAWRGIDPAPYFGSAGARDTGA